MPGSGENSKTPTFSKLEVFDELEEFGVLGVGFGGEAGDEGGAEGDAGDPLAEFLEEGFDLVAGDLAAHGVEDLVVDVLEGHVDVFDEVAAVGEGADHVVGEAAGVGVHEAEPGAGGFFLDEFVEGFEHAA